MTESGTTTERNPDTVRETDVSLDSKSEHPELPQGYSDLAQIWSWKSSLPMIACRK
jgi:hypothetical protein